MFSSTLFDWSITSNLHTNLFIICCIFENFRFNLSSPIYMNMVRDPAERIISWYNYIRAPWYIREMIRDNPDYNIPSPTWLKKVIV